MIKSQLGHLLRSRKLLALIAITQTIMVGYTLTSSRLTSAQKMTVRDDADYSNFQHTSAYHVRLPCSLCHKRDSNSAQPAMPGRDKHLPCAGCHVKQFADSSNAICGNCHSNAQAGTLKAFPRLSSFNMKFDHANHMA